MRKRSSVARKRSTAAKYGVTAEAEEYSDDGEYSDGGYSDGGYSEYDDGVDEESEVGSDDADEGNPFDDEDGGAGENEGGDAAFESSDDEAADDNGDGDAPAASKRKRKKKGATRFTNIDQTLGLKPKALAVKVSWNKSMKIDKKKLKEMFAKFGRVKHCKIGTKQRARVIFRTPTQAQMVCLPSSQKQFPVGLKVELDTKLEPSTKVLVHWEDPVIVESDVWDEFSDVKYVRMGRKKEQKAIVSFTSQDAANLALTEPSDTFSVEEYVAPEIVKGDAAKDLAIKNLLDKNKGNIVPPAEMQALRDLYNQCGGSEWNFKMGWDGVTVRPDDPAGWYGVTVRDGNVIGLELPSNNLKGPLPSSIGNLVYLTSLWLQHNNLQGDIPDSIANMKGLRSLYLHFNHFKRMPEEIAHLQHLRLFGFQNNDFHLSDGVPPIIYNMQCPLNDATVSYSLLGETSKFKDGRLIVEEVSMLEKLKQQRQKLLGAVGF